MSIMVGTETRRRRIYTFSSHLSTQLKKLDILHIHIQSTEISLDNTYNNKFIYHP